MKTSRTLSSGRILSLETDLEGDVRKVWSLTSPFMYEGQEVEVFPDGEMGWGGEQEAESDPWDALKSIPQSQRYEMDSIFGILLSKG